MEHSKRKFPLLLAEPSTRQTSVYFWLFHVYRMSLFGYYVKQATLPALLTINIRHPFFSKTFSQQEPTTRVLKVEISEKWINDVMALIKIYAVVRGVPLPLYLIYVVAFLENRLFNTRFK